MDGIRHSENFWQTEGHDRRSHTLTKEVSKNTSMLHLVRSEQRELKERIIKMETRSMRDNLILFWRDREWRRNYIRARREASGHTGECPRTLLSIDIVHCHRLPQSRTSIYHNGPRNVVARFADRNDISVILKNARKLKGHDPAIYINQQYPREIAMSRRTLMPVYHAVRANKLRASLVQDRLYIDGSLYTVYNIWLVPFRANKLRASLVEDRLYIDGSLYTVDNIWLVPFNISTLHVTNNPTAIGFLGQLSHLRNFYPAPLTPGTYHRRHNILVCRTVLPGTQGRLCKGQRNWNGYNGRTGTCWNEETVRFR